MTRNNLKGAFSRLKQRNWEKFDTVTVWDWAEEHKMEIGEARIDLELLYWLGEIYKLNDDEYMRM